jgi:hypothetical protein
MRSTQATVAAATRDARLLAMADRLFHEFEHLPVRTVFKAVRAARLELREARQGVPAPEDIELLARQRLLAESWRTRRPAAPTS